MRKYISVFSTTLSVLVLALLAYHYFFHTSTVYVRTGYILENYKAMIAAREQLNNDMKQAQQNVDTLYKRMESLGKKQQITTGAEREQIAYQFGMAQSDYEKYTEGVRKQFEEKQAEYSGKVILQLNSFIKTYAEEQGYDYVLGTTNEGSILFGKTNLDISEEVLKEINKEFDAAKK